MDIGFETIGNATVICYDRGPILVTDPWIEGGAYFGSWSRSYIIPEEQRTAILASKYVWFSHGHPDHLNADSVSLFQKHKILLPDHYGGRIAADLKSRGFDVSILRDKEWVVLSPRIKVLCIADYNQDAILLIDINGRLVVNLNDATDRGWAAFVRRVIQRYQKSFLLALSGYGDAMMINYFNEEGVRIVPRAAKKHPIGRPIARAAESFGATFFVPFSSMHKYQRRDSIWANEYVTRLIDYPIGFRSVTSKLLPAYITYDCEKDRYCEINPAETPPVVFEPEYFGDNWSERLEKSDVIQASNYFRSISHLKRSLDFINLRVGGQDHFIEFTSRKFDRGITFEAPRYSLMTSIQCEVFDDMLIGNYMKTTLHGQWPLTRLHPDFTSYVAKYADNGRAKTEQELGRYFSEYARRMGIIRYFRHFLEERSEHIFRSYVPPNSALFQAGRKMYWILKGASTPRNI
jgi:hypothetical protein